MAAVAAGLRNGVGERLCCKLRSSPLQTGARNAGAGSNRCSDTQYQHTINDKQQSGCSCHQDVADVARSRRHEDRVGRPRGLRRGRRYWDLGSLESHGASTVCQHFTIAWQGAVTSRRAGRGWRRQRRPGSGHGKLYRKHSPDSRIERRWERTISWRRCRPRAGASRPSQSSATPAGVADSGRVAPVRPDSQ